MPILYTSRDFGQPIPDLEIRNASKVIGYQTPLFFAAGNGDDDLVESGLPRQVREEAHLLGSRPRIRSIVKMLLDRGADSNHCGSPDQSPLLWALVTQYASLHNKIERSKGLGTRHYDAIGDKKTVVSLLLQYGVDPNITDAKGKLHCLVVERGFNSNELVTQLLKAGINPNIKDKHCRTPFMDATVRGMDQAVTALLKPPNIERDASDIFGRTALMEATRRHKSRLVKAPITRLRKADFSDNDDELEKYPVISAELGSTLSTTTRYATVSISTFANSARNWHRG